MWRPVRRVGAPARAVGVAGNAALQFAERMRVCAFSSGETFGKTGGKKNSLAEIFFLPSAEIFPPAEIFFHPAREKRAASKQPAPSERGEQIGQSIERFAHARVKEQDFGGRGAV